MAGLVSARACRGEKASINAATALTAVFRKISVLELEGDALMHNPPQAEERGATRALSSAVSHTAVEKSRQACCRVVENLLSSKMRRDYGLAVTLFVLVLVLIQDITAAVDYTFRNINTSINNLL